MTIRSAVILFAAVGMMGGGAAVAQDAKQPAATAAIPGMPPLPKPGPDQDVLKAREGTWDATVEAWMGPGAPPMTSHGVQTDALLGGLWLVTDFKGDFAGIPFLGHGVAGFDAVKKKYISTWVDSMSLGPSLGEATYDAATKTMTGWAEGPDMTGQVSKMKQVDEQKDANTHVLTMYMPGPDGKDIQAMKITYKRKAK